MATSNIFVLLTNTRTPTTIKMGIIFAFPSQNWLCNVP